MRLLGVDLGTVRIGLALAEPDALRARPLTTIARGKNLAADAAALARIANSSGIGELVVGLPLDMSGTEGDAARAARAWAIEMAARTGLPVRLRDERLSSHVAESRLGPARRGRDGGPPGPTRRAARRARIDREAATVILEDELDGRGRGEPGELVAVEDREPADQEAPKSGTIDRTAGGGAAAGLPEEPA